MTISITKKQSPYFLETDIGKLATQSPIDSQTLGITAPAANFPLIGSKAFRQPAVFSLDPQLKTRDENGMGGLGVGLGAAAFGMALSQKKLSILVDKAVAGDTEALEKIAQHANDRDVGALTKLSDIALDPKSNMKMKRASLEHFMEACKETGYDPYAASNPDSNTRIYLGENGNSAAFLERTIQRAQVTALIATEAQSNRDAFVVFILLPIPEENKTLLLRKMDFSALKDEYNTHSGDDLYFFLSAQKLAKLDIRAAKTLLGEKEASRMSTPMEEARKSAIELLASLAQALSQEASDISNYLSKNKAFLELKEENKFNFALEIVHSWNQLSLEEQETALRLNRETNGGTIKGIPDFFIDSFQKNHPALLAEKVKEEIARKKGPKGMH